jgi:hypothetical protein
MCPVTASRQGVVFEFGGWVTSTQEERKNVTKLTSCLETQRIPWDDLSKTARLQED